MTQPIDEGSPATVRSAAHRSTIIPAAIIAGAFVLAAGAWATWSDSLTQQLAADHSQMAMFTVLADWSFVLVTGILLFVGVVVLIRSGRRSAAKLTDREQALRRTVDQLETVVGLSPLPIMLMDRELKVIVWNAAAERVFGWTEAEVVGTINPIVPSELAGERLALRARAMAGEEISDFETVRIRKDGTPVDVSLSIAAWNDEEGTPGGTLLIFSDITDRKRAQEQVDRLNEGLEQRVAERTEELVEANQRLETATRAKSAFLATMSHELRTPLNSIIGFSSILRDRMPGPLNDEQGKQIDIVYHSARHLLQLINGVLTLSKVEAGRDEPVVSEFVVDEVVAEEVERVRPLAARRGVELSLSPSGVGATMRSDRTKFGQILLNLLSNAIKFTDEGRVDVIVAVDGDRLRVAVRDTGRGIGPDDLERIFEDFFQAPSSPSDQDGGTGLGLPLSKRLAQLLRGTIEVRSTIGKGSEFVLAVPLDLPGAATAGSDHGA